VSQKKERERERKRNKNKNKTKLPHGLAELPVGPIQYL
jgi:hypothetical protein